MEFQIRLLPSHPIYDPHVSIYLPFSSAALAGWSKREWLAVGNVGGRLSTTFLLSIEYNMLMRINF